MGAYAKRVSLAVLALAAKRMSQTVLAQEGDLLRDPPIDESRPGATYRWFKPHLSQ